MELLEEEKEEEDEGKLPFPFRICSKKERSLDASKIEISLNISPRRNIVINNLFEIWDVKSLEFIESCWSV